MVEPSQSQDKRFYCDKWTATKAYRFFVSENKLIRDQPLVYNLKNFLMLRDQFHYAFHQNCAFVTRGSRLADPPPGRDKVVQIHFLTKNGPLGVIEGQILRKNYGPKSADRTADFGKIKFFRFLDLYGQF